LGHGCERDSKIDRDLKSFFSCRIINFYGYFNRELVKILMSFLSYQCNKFGDIILASASTQFINDNKQQVLQLIKPIIEDTVNELFTGIANRIFQAVPYDDLVPE